MLATLVTSLSARRAWIEMSVISSCCHCFPGSLSARRAWIEIAVPELIPLADPSLSARRAWIEMHAPPQEHQTNTVALRKESVDRNKIRIATIDSIVESLSARRAWIEMPIPAPLR